MRERLGGEGDEAVVFGFGVKEMEKVWMRF